MLSPPQARQMQSIINISIRVIALIAFLLALQIGMRAQAVRPPTPPTSISAEKSRPGPDEEQEPSPLDWDMRAKRAIKYAEKEHQENLARAREASELGNAIAAAYKENQALDMKKLEKLEKITKKIRSEVGAEDDDFTLEDKPHDLAEAVNCVAKVSSSLSEKIIKTPRRVVSASIIDESNLLLELIRIARSLATR